MSSPSAGTDSEDDIEEIPSTSGPVALRPENFPSQGVIPLRGREVARQGDVALRGQASQRAIVFDDGNYQGANIGSTVIHNNYSYRVQIPGPDEGRSAPKKRKVIEASKTQGFVRIDGDLYVDLNAPFSKYARVYKGERRSDALGAEPVAIKLLSINTVEEAKPMKDEALAIRDHPHENVVRYIAADYSTEKFMCMYLVMEMCKKDNLYDHVMEMRRNGRRFSFKDCMSVAKQLSSALKHLHKKGILHRDIKPSNVLFSLDGRVLKLTDFSLVKPLRPGRSVTADSSKRIGTDGWRAPEVYIRNNHGKKSDVYSLGLLLYYVWSNGEQAYGNDPDLNNFNIKTNRNRDLSKIFFENPDEAKLLLEMMLHFDELLRISAKDVSANPLCKNAERHLENSEGEVMQGTTIIQDDDSGLVEGSCIVVFDRITSMMHAFKPSTRAWGHMQRLSPEMTSWNMTVVCTGEYIYALSETRRVFRIKYTEPNAIWETEDDLLLEHGGLPSSTFLDGYIYVIGGSQWSSKISKEGERFDLRARKWSRIPDMNTNRKVHSVVACNGCVYSIGGRDDTVTTPSGQAEGADTRGEKYNPTTRIWSAIAPMNGARHAAFATGLDDKIYILGGWRRGQRLNEAECYDTRTNTWTMIQRMNVPRSYLSAVTVDGKVYAVNGDNVSPLTIEEYDPGKGEWEFVDRMDNMTIWACASAAVNLPTRIKAR